MDPRLAPEHTTPEALGLALGRNDLDAARALLDAGVSPNHPQFDADPLLARAVARGFRGAVDLLLDHDVDVNAANLRGWTALMAACNAPDLGDVTGVLLDAGADPSAVDARGRMALTIAILANNAVAVREILSVAPVLADAVWPIGDTRQTHGDQIRRGPAFSGIDVGDPDARCVPISHRADDTNTTELPSGTKTSTDESGAQRDGLTLPSRLAGLSAMGPRVRRTP